MHTEGCFRVKASLTTIVRAQEAADQHAQLSHACTASSRTHHNCRVFFSCWNGESSRYECPPGLAYDTDQRVCVWADLVDRCDQREVAEGFVCPDPAEVDQPGVFTRHAHPTDCRKFYVCIEGQARPYGCSLGTVFNVDSLQCDDPENVQGCENYYGDLDVKNLKKAQTHKKGGRQSASSDEASSS
ncbi:hypothetical protein HPB50_028405 [Hyalomma asiaticum]|nr:hypothetical protein HPB50_028405 [Hyalomma asiaticum]